MSIFLQSSFLYNISFSFLRQQRCILFTVPYFFREVAEGRKFVGSLMPGVRCPGFDGPPSWFLNATKNWGEYKMLMWAGVLGVAGDGKK